MAQRYALVVCDTQPDLLGSLAEDIREKLLANIKDLVDGAKQAGWLIVYTGLKFQAAYDGVPPRHRLFGGLRRLSARQGGQGVHWLMEGHAGAEIHPALQPAEEDIKIWRQTLCPSAELFAVLSARNITKVTVAGVKTAQGVLSTCEALVDHGALLYIVRECVADDNAKRGAAVVDHVLPQFADVLDFDEFKTSMGQEMMMDRFVELKHRTRAG